jgi:M6 family metalloprotease-like protein
MHTPPTSLVNEIHQTENDVVTRRGYALAVPKRNVLLGVLVSLVFVVACGSESAQPEPTTSTIQTDIPSPDQLIDTYTDSPQSLLASPEECHITDIRAKKGQIQRTALVGFPRPDTLLAPRILVVPFWFTDGQAPTSSIGATLGALRGATHYFKEVSWGKVAPIVETAPESLWLQIPRTAADLYMDKDSPGPLSGEVKPIQSILDFATPELRLDDYDIVYLVGSPTLMHWASAAMEIDAGEWPHVGPGGTVKRAVIMTHNHSDTFLAAHELGHAWLNLNDLYAMQTGVSDFVGLNRFDLMYGAGLNQYNANDMTIWNKYLAGWVEQNQLRCVTEPGTTTHFVSTNSITTDQAKAVAVKISETKVLMIDTWRKSEFNLCCNETIAYVVDSSRIHGAGPYRLQGSMKSPGDQVMLDESHLSTKSEWTILPNEVLTISKVTIRLVKSDDSGALIELVVGE